MKRDSVMELFSELELLVLNMHTIENKEHSGPALDLIVKLTSEVAEVYNFIADFEPIIRTWEGQAQGYGYFPGGDPRNFSPDEESCSEKEKIAHQLACEAWDRGERPDPGGPHIPIRVVDGKSISDPLPDGAEVSALVVNDKGEGHVTVAHYGVGTYSMLDETEQALLDRLLRILYG